MAQQLNLTRCSPSQASSYYQSDAEDDDDQSPAALLKHNGQSHQLQPSFGAVNQSSRRHPTAISQKTLTVNNIRNHVCHFTAQMFGLFWPEHMY